MEEEKKEEKAEEKKEEETKKETKKIPGVEQAKKAVGMVRGIVGKINSLIRGIFGSLKKKK